ncbi:RagB/SusD family nutrient uptake outer membrane protein [Pedobacter insulae]|uniref:SusD family protein n=1 Tax=Pedobacter insulae TaxID=414048 RepID=A0A1I2ZXQ3_9SPHI|nr:RagB/SusD family nutrient uptake outer membrane protein [Pedobacter insulae]SFH42613.1 SusD family protein [Pedobacter insulae]
MKNQYLLVLLTLIGFLMQSCTDYLDVKPNKSLVVPSSLDDFQGLLDAEHRGMNSYPINGSISSDDHVFGEGLLQGLEFEPSATYFWKKNVNRPDIEDVNWDFPYRKVFYANVVLDGLKNYTTKNQFEDIRKKELEASARFYRAMGHFEILMHFAEPFDPSKNGQLGIPVRLTSDVNVKIVRSSMDDSFKQIIDDLEYGVQFLSNKSKIQTRPSKWSSLAMLGRVYLTMHDYSNAYEYSKRTLEIDKTLMDYKSLNSNLPYSFKTFNSEVIFHQRQFTYTGTSDAENVVNPELVNLYDNKDQRIKYFFIPSGTIGKFNFRGNYTGDYYHFGGIATDEVVLNLAESAFRVGKENEALEAINYLLENRMESGFTKIVGLTGSNLLKKIVLERRKELLYRGIRWLDLKRHNLYPELAVTLRRNFNIADGTLEPGSSRYTFMIPPTEMNLNPMQQNVR